MLANSFYIAFFSVSMIACIIALIFSLMTIITIILYRQCHTVTNLLICNTSVILIFYAICNFAAAVYGLREDWAINQPICVFHAYFFLVFAAALCYSYSIQAISRLIVALFYKHRRLLSWSTHWIIIVSSWFLSILFPIEPFFFDGAYIYESESRICLLTSKKFSTAMYSVVTTFVIPFVIIAIAYSKILYTIYQSKQRVQPIVPNILPDANLKINRNREMKLAQNMIITLGCFMCGGIPFLTLMMWQVIVSDPPPDVLFLLSFISMSVFSSVMMFCVFYLNDRVRKIVSIYFCQHL
jgi:hypothetical protein